MKHTSAYKFCFIIITFFCLSCDGGDKMLALLERFEEMNRTDVPLCVDSVQPIVHHYDHWWHSRNHRMRAYYMLGCAYRDQGEAPAAIHYYNIAAEQADTTSKNCDYATLFRVYGQMASIYERQNMPHEQIEALEKCSQFALLAKDTLSHILSHERMVVAYYVLDDTAQVISTTKKVRQQYLAYDYFQKAARVFPTAIYISLLNGNFPRARQYLEIFESESGLFDQHGNIAQGRELYYNCKGLYYMGIGKLDSAEYYFRRLQSYGYFLEASEGLLSIFEETKNTDSIVKYSRLHEQALMQWRGTQQAEAIIQSSSMYNYERNQNLAKQKEEEAKIALYASLLLGLLIFILILIGSYTLREAKRKEEEKTKKVIEIGRLYSEAINKHKSLNEDLNFLKRSYAQLKESTKKEIAVIMEETKRQLEIKQKEIEKQKTQLSQYTDRIKALKMPELLLLFGKETTVQQFKHMAEPRRTSHKMDENDWQHLMEVYGKYAPNSYNKIFTLSRQEQRACCLLHMGFKRDEITRLLNCNSQSLTNAMQRANMKLFRDKSAKTLYRNLIKSQNV